MKEIWRDIEGYEGLYQVSNKRRIKSLNYRHTGKEGILKQQKNKDGYYLTYLCKMGERNAYSVHRLVAQAFILNINNLPEINHKDENKENNCADNLEWCDHLYNINYGTAIERMVKTNSNPVLCVEINTIYPSAIDAQRKTGICHSAIANCAKHKKGHYTARGYHWEYVKKGEAKDEATRD